MPTSLLLFLSLIRFLQGDPAGAAEQAAPAGEGATGGEEATGGPSIFPLLIGLVAVFYFVMILPEKKNRKKREAMLAALKKGDEVMTTSGLYGKVVTAAEDRVKIEIADGVRVDFSRAAVQTVVGADEDKKA